MRTAKVIIWSILSVLFLVSIIRSFSYDMFFIDVLKQWTFKAIAFGCVGLLIWYFIKDVVLQFTRKTK